MKNFLIIAVSACVLYSCGDAGVGFNVGKEFPIPIPVTAEKIQGLPAINFNPDEFNESISYTLGAVGAFDDVDLGNTEVIVNGFAYEIRGVNDAGDIVDEAYDIEDFSLELSTNGVPFATIDIAGDLNNQLDNIEKTPITPFDKDELSVLLKNGGEIKGAVVIDFAEIPADGFDFEFVFHFDVLLTTRNL